LDSIITSVEIDGGTIASNHGATISIKCNLHMVFGVGIGVGCGTATCVTAGGKTGVPCAGSTTVSVALEIVKFDTETSTSALSITVMTGSNKTSRRDCYSWRDTVDVTIHTNLRGRSIDIIFNIPTNEVIGCLSCNTTTTSEGPTLVRNIRT